MNALSLVVAWLLLLERLWKHLLVIRFFRRPLPSTRREPALVSILQPILSGDPTLAWCLERNLAARSRYRREFVWLVDTDDDEARRICGRLIARYPRQQVRMVLVPPPSLDVNPKTVKLIAGARHAQGDVLCVLDDDTQLADDALDQCLPFLDEPGVGLAFGLPYYLYFGTLWSGLVATFVNSNSLLTYIPYTALTAPFTINGMFYAMRREVFDVVGGFAGLERIVADDWAMAQRFRNHGYRLAQTPLRHGISTHVSGPEQYMRLIQRWMIFPRESLMRHLERRERSILLALGLAPALAPLVLLSLIVARPSRHNVALTLGYWAYSAGSIAHLNRAYLQRSTPLRYLCCVPLLQLVFPLQLIVALLSPQRINWRGHLMEVQRGGTIKILRRRTA